MFARKEAASLHRGRLSGASRIRSQGPRKAGGGEEKTPHRLQLSDEPVVICRKGKSPSDPDESFAWAKSKVARARYRFSFRRQAKFTLRRIFGFCYPCRFAEQHFP